MAALSACLTGAVVQVGDTAVQPAAAVTSTSGVLPVFGTPEELLADPLWSAYLQRVYGKGPPTSAFPLDVSALQIMYRDHLPSGFLEGLSQWHGDSNVACPTAPGQIYAPMTELDAPQSAYVWHPPMLQDSDQARAALEKWQQAGEPLGKEFWMGWGAWPPHKDGEVVEVTHCTGAVVSRCESFGSWMYALKGSGVFFNVGRTIAFATHALGVQHFLPGNECRRGHCEHQYTKLLTAAKAAGYDTLQFTQVGDQVCGLSALEIVSVHANGTEVCGAAYTGGWGGTQPCACSSDLKCASCLQ